MAKIVDERGDVRSTQELDKKVTVSSTEARQGGAGRPVLMVLIGGLFLALIAWGAAEMFGESTDNDAATDRQQTTPAQNGQATPANQGTIDNTPANGAPMQPAPTDRDPTPQTGTTNG
ncbi:hypothetical protein LRX75_21585 [Rhizobium sp. DKSPLA3]|uniref:Uncharacterized protein n=1 Tax=Rhizobium quercicola TaxID=2901226 RepID=A0A9X1NXE4_9HYPH|nr:hypothetical protein [Rhizobium quercicola]MCD7111629.1 hypothetical protein [Rhizobium quercicola]